MKKKKEIFKGTMYIKKDQIKGKWYKFSGAVEFLIRPFKATALEDVTSIEAISRFKFMYCLVDWKGINGEDDKTPLKCNEESKELFYDYYTDVTQFIIGTVLGNELKLEKSVKN